MKRIVDWVTYEQLEKKQKEYNSIRGITLYNAYSAFNLNEDDKNLRKYTREIKEFDEFYEDAIVKELVDNKYVICGDTHQYYAIPVFEDGYCILSMRKWGEIMAKAINLILYNGQGYRNYKDFYIASLCEIEEKLPNGCDIDG